MAAPAPGKVDLEGGGPTASSQADAPARSQTNSSLPPDAAQEAVMEAGREVVRSAVMAVRQGGSEIHMYVVSNPYSVTVLSFLGGIALTVATCIFLLNVKEVLTHPLGYCLNIYLLFFGLAIIAIDGPSDRFPTVREKVLTYASFLHNNTNRTLFYGFIACQEISTGAQNGQGWREVVGWYFLLVAVLLGALTCHNRREAPTDRISTVPPTVGPVA